MFKHCFPFPWSTERLAAENKKPTELPGTLEFNERPVEEVAQKFI